MIKVLTTIMLIFLACQAQDQPAAPNLRIATDPSLPPLEFLEEGTNNPVGLDLELLAAFAAAAGNINYEIVQLPWAEVFRQTETNEVDLAISGITINDERRQAWDFSVPYFISSHKILAREGTDITSAQNLLNKRVAVRDGTTGAGAVEGLLGADNANIQRYPGQNEAIQAVVDGQADAYVDDNAVLEYYAKNNAGYVVIEDVNAFPREFYGLLFPKGSDLVGSWNQAITSVLESGQYATIYEGWLGATPDVALLLEAGAEDDGALEEGGNEEAGNGEGELDWADNIDINVNV